MAVPPEAPRLVQLFCDKRIPPSDDLRLEVVTRGNEITIVERRPPWNPDAAREWTSLAVAKLRWDPASEEWSLRSTDSGGRWHRYDGISPSRELGTQLVEIDRDPSGIFWG